MNAAPTLQQALAAVGITSKPRNDDLGKRDLYRNGELLGAYNAHEAWAALNNGTFDQTAGGYLDSLPDPDGPEAHKEDA